jgi:hypothetical protein
VSEGGNSKFSLKIQSSQKGETPMKNMMKMIAGIVLSAAIGGIGTSHAQTAYTNEALKGCYGFLSNSVDVAVGLNRSTVGTICFNGNASIIPNVGALDQTGWWQNTNGIPLAVAKVPGNYAVTNVPGQGMGELVFGAPGCGTYAFSINSVDPGTGIAHGFQFSLLSSKGCTKSPDVVGGTAYLQP